MTVNSFLATGGDNFPRFNDGTAKQDTGKTDLQAMVDYMDEFADTGRRRRFRSTTASGQSGSTSRPARRRRTSRATRDFDVSSLVDHDRGRRCKDTEVEVTLATPCSAPSRSTTAPAGRAARFRRGNGKAAVSFTLRTAAQLSVVAEPSDTHGRDLPRVTSATRSRPSRGWRPAGSPSRPSLARPDLGRASRSRSRAEPKGWAAVKIGKKQYKGKLVDGKVTDQAAEVPRPARRS